jgi:hypothetical protein
LGGLPARKPTVLCAGARLTAIQLGDAGPLLEEEDGEVPLAGNGGEPVAFVAGGGLGTRSVLPSAICTGLSREPSDGNGWPLARPEAFSAS